MEPFPLDFRMIAGNALSRNSTLPNPDPNPVGPWPNEPQAQRAQRAIGFNCLHYAAGNDERTLMRNHLPTKAFMDSTCTDGIRLELQFPSCWNGDLDGGSAHNDHVAYPDGVITGNCPAGYDRRLVSLFYETIIATDAFAAIPGQFVLANGDPTGYGYHGDFIAAWQEGALAAAITSCNHEGSSGEMSECSAFSMTQNSNQCRLQYPLPAAIANEDTEGPMQGLVNGHPIYPGPAPALRPAQQQNIDADVAADSQARGKAAVAAFMTPTSLSPTAPTGGFSASALSSAATTPLGAENDMVAVIVEEVVVVVEDVAVVEAQVDEASRRGGHVHKHIEKREQVTEH